MGSALDLYRRTGEHSTYHIATHKTNGGYYCKAYRLDKKWNGTAYAPTTREPLLSGNFYSTNDRQKAIRQAKQDAGLVGVKTDIYSY